ncbi:MAG: hypothetical protein LBV04_00630 [Deferribacteraceae bacterium]|jgi:hypothetical protein|nr:hypothetical protein [Deferribacteraceae bacterium]
MLNVEELEKIYATETEKIIKTKDGAVKALFATGCHDENGVPLKRMHKSKNITLRSQKRKLTR